MNGFITKRMWAKAALLLCSGAPLAAAGCYEYKDLVDPCYPQRYNNMARNEVNGALAAQVNQGHVLDQTVWNYDFDPSSDRLNSIGLDHLSVLARRLPQPDTLLFLQTAQVQTVQQQGDVIYDPANPEKLAATRQDLDARRAAAVQKFLLAETGGRYNFQVAVIDPYEVGLQTVQVGTSIVQMYLSSKGSLTGGGAASGASASGGAGATGGGGGR